MTFISCTGNMWSARIEDWKGDAYNPIHGHISHMVFWVLL